MDHELLVEEREDGEALVALLRGKGFDVTAAFWLREDSESPWLLCLASKDVDTNGIREAYRTVLDALRQQPGRLLDSSTIKLIRPDEPLAKAVIDFQTSHPMRMGTWIRGSRLGSVNIHDAYIYPQPQAAAAMP